jgi:multiple sugar transport system substrate-binding protein
MTGPLRADGLSRRSLLLGAGGLVGAGALAGCGGNPLVAADDGGTLVRFWNLLSGGDGVLLQELLDEVRQEMPGADIENITLAWGGPYYTKLAMASAGGRSPEVAILHMARLPGYAPGGLLDPWDLDLLAELGVREEDFAPVVWERAQYEGQVFAIPLDTHPFILFYNTEVAEQAGLLGEEGRLAGLDSPEAFLEAARAMAEVTGEFGVSYGYVGDAAQAWRGFFTFYRQTGADMDLSGEEVELDRDAAVQVVEFMQELFTPPVANPDDDISAGIAAFVAGRTGMLFSGDWELRTMQNAGLPFDAVPIPPLFGQPAAYADSHSFVLPTQLAVDEERRQATHQFVAHMLQRSLLWAEAGHIPSFQPVTESEEYAELTPQAHYVEAGENVVFDPAAWFTGSGANFQLRMSQAMQEGFQGDATAEQVVDEMTTIINTFLATPNPA